MENNLLKYITILTSATMICTACGRREIDPSVLEMASDNRVQLEQAIGHFAKGRDDLKYDAALFLIENMPYHASIYGGKMPRFDSLYWQMSQQPLARRGDHYARGVKEIGTKGLGYDLDIHRIGARQLTTHINKACDAWRKTAWAGDYPDDIFFNYVLPYRLADEPVGNWRHEMLYLYPNLGKNEVRSTRGDKIEAESASATDGEVREALGTSGDRMLWMEKAGESFTLAIHTERSCRKTLVFKYSAPDLNPTLAIAVNGGRSDTVVLHATNDANTYIESRTLADVRLAEGDNTVKITNCGKGIAVDYLMVKAVEPLSDDVAVRMNRPCVIVNGQSGKAITFSKPQRRDGSSLLSLSDVEQGNPWQTLQICSRGFGCCTVSPLAENRDSLCMEAEFANYTEGARGAQFRYKFGAHQLWTLLPSANGRYRIMGKDSGLFLEAREDGKGNMRLYLSRYANRASQEWEIRTGSASAQKQRPLYGAAIREAMKVYDYTSLWKWCGCNTIVPPTLATLLKSRTGNCHEEAEYAVTLCRYLGIPATIDFTPHWGNRSQAHEWPVLIDERGKGMPFYMKAVLGDTTTYFHSYKKPKVFRTRFAVDTAYQRIVGQDHLPEQWMTFPCYTDVTAEYCAVADVTLAVPDTLHHHGVAYVCVFDNRQWVPVFWGEIKGDMVTFTDMARGIMYMAGVPDEHGHIKPFGNPFCLMADGTRRDIVLDKDDRRPMTLRRKFPFLGAQDLFNTRMSRGRFQASHTADFANPVELYCFNGITNGNWYDIEVNESHSYRFVRYIGPNGSYCNINEMQLCDTQGRPLRGKVIGTQGSAGQEKEKVFDGDILTGFNGISPDGHWVGLDLASAKSIGRIRFIGRNDGNTVEVGDDYELYCWADGEWQMLDRRTATANVLHYDAMPSGGLYVLRDRTKGWEERIFTYEDGQQVWW